MFSTRSIGNRLATIGQVFVERFAQTKGKAGAIYYIDFQMLPLLLCPGHTRCICLRPEAILLRITRERPMFYKQPSPSFKIDT